MADHTFVIVYGRNGLESSRQKAISIERPDPLRGVYQRRIIALSPEDRSRKPTGSI